MTQVSSEGFREIPYNYTSFTTLARMRERWVFAS
jgi:hypothetical protein